MNASTTNTPLLVAGVRGRGRERIRAAFVVEMALLTMGILFFAVRVLPRAWSKVNTDFPNYYVTARLMREGYAIDRVYDWDWFARQKDRMAIDQPVSGFIPHTPFSALVMLPFSGLDPLAAKHAWILFNLLLLLPTLALLKSLSALPWRWLILGTLLSVPLYRNLEYGQYYVLLLFLLTYALWLYVHQRHTTAGVLVAIAAGLKIFPLVILLYFLRKRDWRALAGMTCGLLSVVLLTIRIFGFPLVSRFAQQILPSALRGEAMDPYALAANSISALVHHLFAYEPALNPHPVAHAIMAIAVLQPLLQMLVLAPVLLLCSPDGDERSDPLEWATLVVALLGISTLPASYHFVILLLPCAIWVGHLIQLGRRAEAAICIVLYFLIGWPIWPKVNDAGWGALLAVPRLCLVLILILCMVRWLWNRTIPHPQRQRVWATAFILLCFTQMYMLWRHERTLYDSQRWQLSLPSSIFSVVSPSVDDHKISFSAMTIDGWRLGQLSDRGEPRVDRSSSDYLSSVLRDDVRWIERDGTEPDILRQDAAGVSTLVESNAQQPTISADGQSMAFVRNLKGQGSLWIMQAATSQPATRVTEPELDVYDIAFGPEDNVFFSAAKRGGDPQLFEAKPDRTIVRLRAESARYPSISPNGRWLAYSALRRGVWRLTLRDLASGADLQLGSADCNEFSPTWEVDSHTLFYASDCGRGLWQTTLYRRTVIP